ncbi:UNKNOWN [Stylonychia lemnae]|uniref:Uncharacterized protein n=1 Tax=Stylonychia lemnae TaxID=5949 RepID=A0A078B8Y3_STYLE|nr:UNKNOWN [Stylonychia lemnae]|eukprot:CDW90869.1 UNKNOWN [Stylonychia lemnae]
MSILYKFRKFIRQFDCTGAPIALNYNNSNTFKTTLGGSISQIYEREKLVTYKQVHKTANRDDQTSHLTIDNFDFALGIIFFDGQSHLWENQEDMTSLGINQNGWFCLSNIDFVLKGQFSSTVRSNIRFRIRPCENKTNVDLNNLPPSEICMSPQQISDLQQISTFNFAYLQSYFDQDEFNGSPVKHEINMAYLNMKNDQSYGLLLETTKNHVTTYDNWLSNYLTSSSYEFYSLKPGMSLVGVVKPNINDQLTVYLTHSDQEIFIERKMITILDIFSVSGGFANTVLLLSRICALFYSVQLFKQMLISRLCWIRQQSQIDIFHDDLEYDYRELIKNEKQKSSGQLNIKDKNSPSLGDQNSLDEI